MTEHVGHGSTWRIAIPGESGGGFRWLAIAHIETRQGCLQCTTARSSGWLSDFQPFCTAGRVAVRYICCFETQWIQVLNMPAPGLIRETFVLSLRNKTAIVTGAGSGIGEKTAEMLAADGASVVLVGRRLEPLQQVADRISAAGGTARIHSADLTNGDQAAAVAGFALDELGRIDVLVNNAGFSSKVRSVRYVPPEEWDAVFKVNMEGVYRLTQAALPGMIERGDGTVITTSSMAALRPGILGGAPYSAAKAAVRAFSHHLNSELRDKGIRATVIVPGEVDTPILMGRPAVPDDEARRTMMQPEDVARCIHLAATLPQRTVIEELIVMPRVLRDMSAEMAVALTKQS